MYVAGFARVDALGDWFTTYQAALRAGLPERQANLYANGKWSGADPLQCIARGGIVNARVWGSPAVSQFDMSGGSESVSFACQMPAPAPASAQAPITVNTAIQSTASPQISPVLVQQDQPTGSGVNAGTQQSSPAPQSSSAGSAPVDYQAYLDAQAEREASFLDTVKRALSPAAPAGSDDGAAYYTGSPVPEVAQAGAGEIAAPSKLEQYTPWIVFATAIAALAATLKRNRSKRGT